MDYPQRVCAAAAAAADAALMSPTCPALTPCSTGHLTQAPQVRFTTRINLSCVDRDGRVRRDGSAMRSYWTCKACWVLSIFAHVQIDPRHFPVLGTWRPEYTMERVLLELRKEMLAHHNRKLPQPPEGSSY